MKHDAPYETQGTDHWWHPLLALLITLLVMVAFLKIVAIEYAWPVHTVRHGMLQKGPVYRQIGKLPGGAW
jgi:hypothetical protein